MNRRAVLISLVVVCSAVATVAQGRGVASPDARDAALERARALLQSRPLPSMAEFRKMKDPFNPPETDLKDLVVDTTIRPKDSGPKPVSDTDIIQMLSTAIAPSGIVELGGEPYLLFGEKRLKTGDTYTITKDGVDYVVIIDSIEPSRFSIRYGSQILFRQIR